MLETVVCMHSLKKAKTAKSPFLSNCFVTFFDTFIITEVIPKIPYEFVSTSFYFTHRWSSRQEVAELLTSKTASSKLKILEKTLKSIFGITSKQTLLLNTPPTHE